VLLLLVLLPGCGEGESASNCPGAHTGADPDQPPRIVSLTPAVTQMLIDLDLAGHIVGAGQYDPVAPEQPAVVGNLHRLDYERLLAVNPTHVFIQPERTADPPERLRDLADRHGWVLRDYWLDTVDGVFEVLTGPDGVGAALEVPRRARQLRERIEADLQTIEQHTAQREPVRVLMLAAVEPLTGVGPGTFWDELLQIAGGTNVVGDMAVSYPVLGRERVLAMDPAVIVLLGGRPDVSTGPIDPPAPLAGLSLRAVRAGRVMRLGDPAALLPSTTIARVTAKMAGLLHPDQRAALSAIAKDASR